MRKKNLVTTVGDGETRTFFQTEALKSCFVFLLFPKKNVDTVVYEHKLNKEVSVQRLFSYALEAHRHPNVFKGFNSFVLTFSFFKASHARDWFILGNAVEETQRKQTLEQRLGFNSVV